MKTALIILNYNNARDTRNCIESIREHNTADIKIIVVDNASRTDQVEQIKRDLAGLYGEDYKYYDSKDDAPEVLPKVSLVETHENLGYARGNNVGLEMAYADPEIEYVMILNNDILFVQDIIPGLIERHKQLDKCAILSPVLYKKDMQDYDYTCARRNATVSSLINRNFLHYWWRMRHKSYEDVYRELFLLNREIADRGGSIEIELPSGSCMLVRKDYFKALGSFDPATFLYYEENILYKRIAATGYHNYLSLDHKCIHLGAATVQTLPSSLRVIRASRESERYYVKTYTDASALTKAVHRLSTAFFMATFRLQKLLSQS